MKSIQRMIIIALLVSIGLILHFVESMIPMSFIVPGARLGLANIVSLLALVLYGFKEGLLVLLLRVLLGSFLAGTFMTINFYLSISGGLLSFFAMSLLYYCFKKKFSLIGVSVFGSTFHNIGQLITAYWIINNPGIFYYLPYLVLMAVPTGIGVGLVTYFTSRYLLSGSYRRF
ncbi:MAG: Gx transporter family protein [Halanaerobiaceae bacterium]|nr:Gx transporter family protein [Halanaerobiaceae bacterium]